MYFVVHSATWCNPCKAVKKVLEQFPELNVLTNDVDENPDITAKSGVRGVPTIIAYTDNDQEIDRKVGVVTLEGMKHWLAHLDNLVQFKMNKESPNESQER